MSTLKVDTITDSSSGLTTTINGFTPQTSNMAGRNLVINGHMLISQRGTGAFTDNNSFAVDRWKNISNTTDFSVLQSSVVPSGQEFTKSVHVTPTATKTHNSSDYFFISHYVEGYNIGGLGYGTSGAKTITISFWVRSSKTGTYSLGMKNSVANRSRQNEYTISAADTWEKKTIVVPGETTGSWPIDNTRGIAFDFSLGGQNTATSSVNTWLSNNSNMSTNQVNFFDDTNNNFYLTGVKVEVGSAATDFDHRNYGEELALCQRYFFNPLLGRTTGSIYYPIHFNQVSTGNNGLLRWQVTFPVSMRTSPSLTHSLTNAKFQTSAPNGTDNWAFYRQNSGWSAKAGNSDISVLNIAPSVNQANVGAYYVTPNDTLATAIGIGGGATFNFSAEL